MSTLLKEYWVTILGILFTIGVVIGAIWYVRKKSVTKPKPKPKPKPIPKPCPNNCSGNGTCDKTTGKCKCADTHGGDDCSINFDNILNNQFYLQDPNSGQYITIKGSGEGKEFQINMVLGDKRTPLEVWYTNDSKSFTWHIVEAMKWWNIMDGGDWTRLNYSMVPTVPFITKIASDGVVSLITCDTKGNPIQGIPPSYLGIENGKLSLTKTGPYNWKIIPTDTPATRNNCNLIGTFECGDFGTCQQSGSCACKKGWNGIFCQNQD
jgi:hypothetical protein